MITNHRVLVSAICGALLGCSQAADDRVEGCYELRFVRGDSLSEPFFPLDLGTTEFLVRLDRDSVHSWVAWGQRLGRLAEDSATVFLPAAWHDHEGDSIRFSWWGGSQGVRAIIPIARGQVEGIAYARDDAACPGGPKCWRGTVVATKVACPVTDWIQADSTGWVPWRE